MSEVRRICGHCGAAVALDGRYCAACGYDFESALPAQSGNLPLALGKAALPMLVGAAGLVLRAGWQLAQSEWAKEAARNVFDLAFNLCCWRCQRRQRALAEQHGLAGWNDSDFAKDVQHVQWTPDSLRRIAEHRIFSDFAQPLIDDRNAQFGQLKQRRGKLFVSSSISI
jgi:hypothetical protein